MHFTKKVTFGHFTASRILISVLGHLPPEKLSLKAKKAVSENEKGEEKTGKEKKKAKYAGGLGVFSKIFVFGPHSRVHTFFEGKYELICPLGCMPELSLCIFRSQNRFFGAAFRSKSVFRKTIKSLGTKKGSLYKLYFTA